MALLSFLDRERSVAHPGYSRWLVPPAALALVVAVGADGGRPLGFVRLTAGL